MVIVVNSPGGASANLHNYDQYKRMDIVYGNNKASIELVDTNSKVVTIGQTDDPNVAAEFLNRFLIALKADDTLFFATTVLEQLLQDQALAKQQEKFDAHQEALKENHLEAIDNAEAQVEAIEEKGGDKDGK